MLLANSVFKPYSASEGELKDVPASFQKNGSKKQKYMMLMQRRQQMGEFMNKHTNIVIFISTPFIAFIMWLLFKRKKLFYAEHVAVMAYVNAFLNILLILIFGPLLYFTRGTPAHTPVYLVMMLSHIIYLGFMYHGLVGYTRKDYWRSMGAGVIAIVAWGILTSIVGFAYVAWGVLY